MASHPAVTSAGLKELVEPIKLTGYLVDVKRVDRAGPELVAKRQRQRLCAIVENARAHSAHYRRKYEDVTPAPGDIRELPVATKSELMTHFEDWVTDPDVNRANVEAFVRDASRVGELFLGRHALYTTSGTTGVPGIFLHDGNSFAATMAVGVRAYPPLRQMASLVPAIVRNQMRGALIVATGGHFAGSATAAMGGMGSGARARVFPVQTPVRQLVRDLEAYQPVVVKGYATVLDALAREQRAGRLHIDPRFVVSTAEPLGAAARQRIETAFDCQVSEIYAATEMLAIAASCDHGRLHVNADWVIVEAVDEDHRPVPDGTASHTSLITNLANRVAPVIRYDLGDSITYYDTPCPCGGHLPSLTVEGRSSDVLEFEGADGTPVTVLPLAISTVAEETPGAYQVQVRQTAPDALHVRLSTVPNEDEDVVWTAIRDRLRGFLSEQGCADVAVERDPEAPTRDPGGGKFRAVVRDM